MQTKYLLLLYTSIKADTNWNALAAEDISRNLIVFVILLLSMRRIIISNLNNLIAMLPTKWVLSIACRQNAARINSSNTDLYALADQYESPNHAIYSTALNSLYLLLMQEYSQLAYTYYKIGIFDIACKHITQYINQYKTDSTLHIEQLLNCALKFRTHYLFQNS
jgi:hypothetical protein